MQRIVRNYINGQWRDAERGGLLDVENPSTGEVLAQVPFSTAAELDRAVAAAGAAFPQWSATPVARRCEPLYRLAELIHDNAESLRESFRKRWANRSPTPGPKSNGPWRTAG